jgi:hypothetical protein
VWSCGQVIGLIDDIPSVAELVDRMVKEAEQVIRERMVGALRSSL